MADQDKKISLVEIILMLMITITADVVELILTLFVAGIVVNILINIPVWLVIQFWLIMRGIPGWWYGGGSIVDIISGGAVPLQTPLLVVNLFINNSKLGSVAGALKGKGVRSF